MTTMAFITVKKVKGNKYYYLVESRREGRKVKQVVLEYIGNEDALARYANNQLKEIGRKNGGDASFLDNVGFKSYKHGSVMALYWMARKIGIEKIIDKTLPPKTIKGCARSRVLLLAMIHRAVDPGSKRAFADWSGGTTLPYYLRYDSGDMTSQSFWEAMDGISDEDLVALQEAVVKRILEMTGEDIDSFHLDYTNYFTFIDSKNGRCVICRRGHNKQKRNDLRQYSLAMLTACTLRMPLAWEVYDGNKNDKSEFKDFSDFVKKRLKKYNVDPAESTVIFDGGSNSEENFKDIGFHFICSASLAGHEELYGIDIDRYETIEMDGGHGRLAYSIGDIELYGVNGKGILTFSQDLLDGQVSEMDKNICRALEDLKEVNERLGNERAHLHSDLRKRKEIHDLNVGKAEKYNAEVRRHNEQKTRGRKKKEKEIPEWNECNEMKGIVSRIVYKGRKSLKEYSEITIARTGSTYRAELRVDEEKKGAYVKKYYGKKLTFTDRTDWTTRQVLEHYGQQECIETDVFRLSKNHGHFNMQPQYHWTDGKIKVQVSIVMISMIITGMLHREVEAAGTNVSTCRMLDVLSSIREGWLIYNGREARRVLEDMNEEQKTLYDIVCRLK